MSELPNGWTETTLEALVSSNGIVTDGDWVETKDQDPIGDVRLTQLADVGDGEFRNRSDRYLTLQRAEQLGCTFLEPGDVLIARMPDPLGRACIFLGLGQAAVTVVDVLVFRSGTELVSPQWVVRAINSPVSRQKILAQAGGTTRQRISGGNLKRLGLPLPPLAEQKRIVDKLDALNAKSALARTELSRIETLVSRFKQAVLSRAFSGGMTSDHDQGTSVATLDADPDVTPLWSVPETWSWCRTDQVGRVGLGRQRSPKNHEGPQMRPYLRSANITWQGVDTSDVKEMNFDDADFKRFKLEVGDVLLNEGSGSAREVGKPAIWRGEIADCCYQNTLLRVQPHRSSSEYLYYYFLLTARAGRFVSSTQGVNIQHIGREGLASYPVPLAPELEQREIVRRIESAFAKIDRLSRAARRALELVGKLDKAILAKAFRGELVPQNPGDEPASALLERIRTEREAAPKAKTKRIKRGTAMTTAADFLNTKLESWPYKGTVTFEELQRDFTGSYDDLRDAVFASLSGAKPPLEQVFDEKLAMMMIRKR